MGGGFPEKLPLRQIRCVIHSSTVPLQRRCSSLDELAIPVTGGLRSYGAACEELVISVTRFCIWSAACSRSGMEEQCRRDCGRKPRGRLTASCAESQEHNGSKNTQPSSTKLIPFEAFDFLWT